MTRDELQKTGLTFLLITFSTPNVVKVTLERGDPQRQISLFGFVSQSAMTDARRYQPPEAPKLLIKDILFEFRFFQSHYLFEDYQRGKLGDEGWVSIGGEYVRLPDRYAVTLLDEDGFPPIDNPDEEFRHPRLYSAENEWVGYIPNAVHWYLNNPEENLLWSYRYYGDLYRLTETAGEDHQIRKSVIKEITDDLKEARDIVCRLEERGGLPLSMVDCGYRARWLEASKDEDARRAALYQARACLLHLLGTLPHRRVLEGAHQENEG